MSAEFIEQYVENVVAKENGPLTPDTPIFWSSWGRPRHGKGSHADAMEVYALDPMCVAESDGRAEEGIREPADRAVRERELKHWWRTRKLCRIPMLQTERLRRVRAALRASRPSYHTEVAGQFYDVIVVSCIGSLRLA